MIGRFTTEEGDFYADPEGEMCLYADYQKLESKLDSLASHVRGVILHQQIAKDDFAYDRAMEFLRKGMESAGCAVEPQT